MRSGVFPRINGLLLSDTAPLVVKFTVREHVDIGGTLKYHMMLYDSYLVSIRICVCVYSSIRLMPHSHVIDLGGSCPARVYMYIRILFSIRLFCLE